MSPAVLPRRLRLLLSVALACGAALLLGCASAPPPDVASQRFDAAWRSGSEKFAAGDLNQAATAFAQAERMAALYDRRPQRLQALLAQAAVALTREDDAAARQAATLAQAEAQGLGDAHAQGVASASLAELQRRAGEPAAALQGFERALAPGALRADSKERLQARMGRALVWQAQGQVAAARDELQLLEHQARAGASPVLSAVLSNQAALLRDAGELAAAVAKAEQALALDRATASPYALAADLELLGGLYRLQGQASLARDSLARALRIVHATGQSRTEARLQGMLQTLP